MIVEFWVREWYLVWEFSTCHQPNVITVAERFALSLRNGGDYL